MHQYPPIGGQYPPVGGQYPPVGGQYPPVGGQYPPVGGQYPPVGGQYPPQQGMQPPQQYPPQQGLLPPNQPPQTFQGWFTIYYNLIQPHEMLEISSWFQSIDRDRSGSITANEIQHCTFGSVPLGFEVAQKLVRVFDKDKSGSIDFYEYAAMHKFLALMQGAFFAGDVNRSGRLDAREIHIALGVGRITVGFPAVQSLFTFYNKDGYGCQFSDFLKLCTHIARAKSVFEWEDVQRRGVLTVDFDKFLQMTGGL